MTSRSSAGLATIAVLASAGAFAQDSRTVREPSFPAVCTTLVAAQSAARLVESKFDTARIQAALDACPVGQAVELQARESSDAFLIQPITLPSGRTLLVDAEVTVFASLNRADYPCPDPGRSSSDCKPLITVAPGSGSGIMGYGVIDGRGGSRLNGENVSWWDHEDAPRPRMIQLMQADNFTLYKITLEDSPKFFVYGRGDFLTVWGVKLTAPATSPNTDGIDPSASRDITITRSFVSVGDDHVAIKAGAGPVANVTVSHNRFFQGHGVSIGSETHAGVRNVLVTELVMDGAGGDHQRVVRIKSDASRGGEVRNVTFENICARNPGRPLEFTAAYSNATGTRLPNFHDIVVRNMHVLNRGDSSPPVRFMGYAAGNVSQPLGITLDNVTLDGFSSKDFAAKHIHHVSFVLGPGPVRPAGFVDALGALALVPSNRVAVTNRIANDNIPYPCTDDSFVYLAGELFAPRNALGTSGTVKLSTTLQAIVAGAPPPTGTVSIFDGRNEVAKAEIRGRVARFAIDGASAGTHVYKARYSGDDNYAPLEFGSVAVSLPGPSGS